jgi:F-type H+-transporting ATPase subunit a
VTIYTPLEHVGIPWMVQAAALAAGLLVLSGWVIRRQLAAADGGLLPDERLTLRNVGELIVEMLCNLGEQAIGHDYRRYLPIVGTIFIFILVSNLLGLIPGVGGGTSDINVTAAWAIISFAVYNYVGFRKHGPWYINQFLGPSIFEAHVFGRHIHVRLLAPFFFLIEVPLHFARIATLAIRLLANMFADHTVIAVWLAMVPIGIPAVFMGLGLLVSFLQAFVFSLLTMIYIGLALEEAH